MIRRLVVVALSLIACHLQTPSLHADPDSGGLIPASVAERYGLERAWYTQARVSPARGESAHLQLHVSLASAQTIFRVTDQHGRTYNISERHLNTFGQPLGVDGSQAGRGREDPVAEAGRHRGDGRTAGGAGYHALYVQQQWDGAGHGRGNRPHAVVHACGSFGLSRPLSWPLTTTWWRSSMASTSTCCVPMTER